MKNRLFPRQSGPDLLTEELVNAVSGNADFEFKPLFALIYGNLRARDAAPGGEDMLRLRLYDKLQWLVQVGVVEKNGKVYRGNAKMLRPLTELLAAKHCRNLLEAAAHATPNGDQEDGMDT